MRGGLIDLFPTGSAVPYRIDLARRRDRDDPHLRRRHAALDLPGARGAHAAGARVPARRGGARALPRAASASASRATRRARRIYKDVSNGLAPAGVEGYLPLFFEATATLFDYLPDGHGASSCTATSPTAAEAFWKDLKSRYELLRGDRDRPLLEPRELYLPVEDLFIALDGFERFDVRQEAVPEQTLPALDVDRRSVEPLRNLKQFAAGVRRAAC